VHYLRPEDTLFGLSLLYKVPLQDIRNANALYGNGNLLHARHYIVIPGYAGPSLSGQPAETEEVETQKVALKRFQLLSKCVDYDMARIYMKSSGWNIEEVISFLRD
jgi:LysM domain